MSLASGQFRRVLLSAVAVFGGVLFGDVSAPFASCGDWLVRHADETADRDLSAADNHADDSSPVPCSGPQCENNSTPPIEPVSPNGAPPRIDGIGLSNGGSFEVEQDSWKSGLLVTAIPSAGHNRRVERPPRIPSQQFD